MKQRTISIILILFALVIGSACVTLTNGFSNVQPKLFATPNGAATSAAHVTSAAVATIASDATIAAVATDIGVPQSMLDWNATVNAMESTGMPTSTVSFDGNWVGTGVTSDATNFVIGLLVKDFKITGMVLKYVGKNHANCTLEVSSEVAAYKVDYLPATIDPLTNIADIKAWNFSAAFGSDLSASGGIDLKVTNQKQAGCNVEVQGAWTANKKAQ